MLPLSYAIRNLFRDPARLAQIVGGSALVVLMVMGATAVNSGMTQVLGASGSPDNAILLGAGSEDSLLRSEVADRAAGIAEASISGIHQSAGAPAVSPEVHQMLFVETSDAVRRRSFARGVTTSALLVHEAVTLIDGTFPGPGELMVGRLAWRRLGVAPSVLAVGQSVIIEDETLRVSGIFAAPGTVMESELWMDLNDIRTLTRRETLSCVMLRLDPEAFPDVDLFTKTRLDLELTVLRESDYYGRLSSFYRPLRGMVWMTAMLIAIGAVLGGINTIYAAFASRIRELATLQSIGYARRAILFSLVQEATLACLSGALVAALLAVLWIDGLAVNFSIGSFVLALSPAVAGVGIGTGVALGLFGALAPGVRCLLPPLPEALRGA